MKWKDNCFHRLKEEKMYADDAHEERFRDAVDCYYSREFFSPGLCKCLYLASWDEEHFFYTIQMINDMVAGGDRNLTAMEDHGLIMTEVLDEQRRSQKDLSAEEKQQSLREQCMFGLALAFLEDRPYELPEEAERSGAPWLAIYNKALQAAAIIDEIPFNRDGQSNHN